LRPGAVTDNDGMRLLTIATAVLSGLALLTAGGVVVTRGLVRLARRWAPALGRFVTVDGVRLHLRNEGEGPAVLLVHGAKGSLYDHEFELAPLLRDRYRVITVDRPGSGYSARVPRDGVSQGEGDCDRLRVALGCDPIGLTEHVEEQLVGSDVLEQ
jgi:hypothetical protein